MQTHRHEEAKSNSEAVFWRWDKRTQSSGRRMQRWGKSWRNWKLFSLFINIQALQGERRVEVGIHYQGRGTVHIKKNIIRGKKLIHFTIYSRNEEKDHEAGPPFMLRSSKSPPQTVPEDLRVQRWVVKLHIWGWIIFFKKKLFAEMSFFKNTQNNVCKYSIYKSAYLKILQMGKNFKKWKTTEIVFLQ